MFVTRMFFLKENLWAVYDRPAARLILYGLVQPWKHKVSLIQGHLI